MDATPSKPKLLTAKDDTVWVFGQTDQAIPNHIPDEKVVRMSRADRRKAGITAGRKQKRIRIRPRAA